MKGQKSNSTRRWSQLLRRRSSVSGVTLVEVLGVLAIVGILMAIVAPGWVAYAEGRSLSAAQDAVLQNLRLTQSEAKRTRRIWQMSARSTSQGVELAVHPASASVHLADWQPLDPTVRLDTDETTVQRDRTQGIYQVQFNATGRVNGSLGKITLTTGQGQKRRCVVISTLLGVIRKAADEACL